MALKSKKLDTVRTDIPVDVVTQVDLVRINLNVPKTTRALWKSEAAKQGKSLSDMIVEAMELSLSKFFCLCNPIMPLFQACHTVLLF